MGLNSIKSDSFLIETNIGKEIFDEEKYIDNSRIKLKTLKEDFDKKKLFLKNGKIDYNFDGISNEVEDFRKYVENIIILSKKIVIKQLSLEKNQSEDKKIFILEMIESFNNIDDNELSLITIQEIVTQLANIVGVDFVRKKNEDDKAMEKFGVTNQDKDRVFSLLEKHGNVEYKDFGQNGPVLIIFPEAHYAGDLLKNNLEAHLTIEKYYNFSATEGISFEDGYGHTNDEIKKIKKDIRKTVDNKYNKKVNSEEEWRTQSLNRSNKYNELLLNNIDIINIINKEFENSKIMISTAALETILGPTIKTIGVEPDNLELIIRNLRGSKNQSFNNKQESYKNHINKIKQIVDNGSLSNNIIFKYRNYHWLKNIQKEVLNGKKSRGKNFIPITLGAAHAPDLINKAKQRGFSGVIYFEANAMNNTFDMKKNIDAYNEGQGLNK